MGDININTLGKSKIANEYLNLIRSEGFNPLIFEATRITEKTQSCIDHIHSNFASTCTSGSIAIEIADHLPVFTILYDPDISPFPDSIEYRDFTNFKSKSFKSDLRKEDWRTVLNCTNINDCLSRFLHKFNKISNKHAPIKVLKIKNKSCKPWITSGLKKSIKTRDNLYKKWLITRDISWHNKYKYYRNKIASINRHYRYLFYNNVLSDSNNTKKMWDNINFIINKKRPNSHIDKLKTNNKHYNQPTSIANALNNYFCDIPSKLASALPKSNHHFRSHLTHKNSKFYFSKISEVEVFLLLQNLDKKKSFGVDKIHPFLLSTAAIEIFKPLTYIINLSITQGVFPDSLKVAKIIPIFKQGSRLLSNNYRPISVLPALSKIFEKCVFNQLMFHFSFHNLITPNQYGFRSGSNTTDCLVDLIDEITKSLDEGEFAVTLFLDLSKAFDTVNNLILLTKLSYYGVKNNENQWFKSYLHSRKQRVFVNGVFFRYTNG